MPTCQGKASQNAHEKVNMVFVKKWTLQGKNQKKPVTIELWKCPIEHCHKSLRIAVKDKSD